jgi:hypothetical protein
MIPYNCFHHLNAIAETIVEKEKEKPECFQSNGR